MEVGCCGYSVCERFAREAVVVEVQEVMVRRGDSRTWVAPEVWREFPAHPLMQEPDQ